MQFCRSLAKYENFNNKRVKCLIGNGFNDDLSSKTIGGVAYFMHRDQRLHDNWSVIYGQRIAVDNNLPFHIVAGISVKWPTDPEATRRALNFSLGGLEEVEEDCKKFGIEFHLLYEQDLITSISERIVNFIKHSNTKCIVVDFSPLKPHCEQIRILEKEMRKMDSCVLYQVDSHNIVPVWEASNVEEPRATEMRQKIMLKFDDFFTEFPNVQIHPIKSHFKSDPIDWDTVRASIVVDESVASPDWAKPGYKQAFLKLHEFIESGLKDYSEKRNDPTFNAISNLSPWLHYGHISAQRVIAEVLKYKSNYPSSVTKFIDEAVVWSEMSDNYCFYNSNYDNLEGAPIWAIETLNKHRITNREYIYSKEQFDIADTHDELWNAAQIQLKREGKMHGYMRMYWAKKILEWTVSPDEAIKYALYFNDHYSLDGADSNGYAGVMWSIAGVHDPPKWGERPVYGKIRYMSFNGAKKKFDVFSYISRYKTLKDNISNMTMDSPGRSHSNNLLNKNKSYQRKGTRVQGSWGSTK